MARCVARDGRAAHHPQRSERKVFTVLTVYNTERVSDIRKDLADSESDADLVGWARNLKGHGSKEFYIAIAEELAERFADTIEDLDACVEERDEAHALAKEREAEVERLKSLNEELTTKVKASTGAADYWQARTARVAADRCKLADENRNLNELAERLADAKKVIANQGRLIAELENDKRKLEHAQFDWAGTYRAATKTNEMVRQTLKAWLDG